MKTIYSVPGIVLLAALAACNYTTALPSETPSVIIATAVPSVALTQGDRASVDVSVTRNGGFAGPVTLTLTGAPAGATAEVTGNPADGSTASLNLKIGDFTTPGTYPLVLTAAGDGIPMEVLQFELRVAQRPASPVAVRYCTGAVPHWVAFQDGDGTWTQAMPSVAGGTTTFSTTLATNRGGLAKLQVSGGFTSLSVQYGTPADLAAAGDTNPQDCGPLESKHLLGSVSGLDADDFALILAGFGTQARVRLDQGNTFELHTLPGGPQDLLATRATPINGTDVLNRMILRRNFELPDGATLPVLDFASAEAFAPAVVNLSVKGLGAGGARVATGLMTSHDQLAVDVALNQASETGSPFVALPESQLLPGDLQTVFVSGNPTTVADGRSAQLYFRAPIDRTVILGAPLTAPTFSIVTTAPALRMRARFVTQGDYDQRTTIAYQQGPLTLVVVSMSADYAAVSDAGYDLVIPDLSGAAGFDPAWALRPGEALLWNASRVGGTLRIGRDVVPTDGATQRLVSLAGTFQP